MSQTRVTFVNDSARIAGAEKSLALLVKNLPADRYRTLVVCPPGEYEGFLRESGIENVQTANLYHYNRANGYVRYMWSLVRLTRVLLNAGTQIVHCNSYRAAHWGIPLSYLLGLPVVCHIRDCRFTRFSSGLMRGAGGRVRFIAVSEAVKESLKQAGVRADRISVIYNGADTSRYNPDVLPVELRQGPGVFRMGLFGRIEERKRHIDAVEAFARLPEGTNAHLYIVGDAWSDSGAAVEKRVRERVVELGLADSVTFTGYRTDIPELMAAMDAVLVPSVDEPFARVILEALSSGKPVIGTYSGGTPEMIEDGRSGLLVHAESPVELAGAIARLAANREFGARLAATGRARVLDLFSVASHVRAVEAVYADMLPARPADHTSAKAA